jgi:asparagine synthase (glutamine-hydrolysing)
MCGITGLIDFSTRSTEAMLAAMTEALNHRGPDDRGLRIWNHSHSIVGLGHRRLSIIDLSSGGHQPMTFRNLSVVYNGEIYNFAELKKQLETAGYGFDTHCDTEVLLKAFHLWGPDCVHKFIGMFAFAIYDEMLEKVYLCRDRAGVKPLYYFEKNDIILFASEIKSLFKHPFFNKKINLSSLSLYLRLGYIPAPYSIFQNTWKVLPGHYYCIDIPKKNIVRTKYWDVLDAYNKPKLHIAEEEALAELDRILISACSYRLVSDVPVGVFLSGGYDSSMVTAILQRESMKKIKTFTIGFHEAAFNEAHYARKVAQHIGTDHSEYFCTQKEALEIIPMLSWMYDEPFGDSSAIPTTLVARLARKDVTVALSADAGDETFAGYGKYAKTLFLYRLAKSLPKKARSLIYSVMGSIDPNTIPIFNKKYNFETRYEKLKEIINTNDPVTAMQIASLYFEQKESDSLLSGQEDMNIPTFFDDDKLISSENEDLDHLLAIDYKTYLVDDILVKVDRATMSVSLEGREPLLDHRIIEFVARLPSNLKQRNGQTKYLLRKLVHSYIPEPIMNRPKMGFGVPIIKWFKEELLDYLNNYINHERLTKIGIINADAAVNLKNAYLSGKKENEQKLWILLMFEMWYERWMP